MNTILICTVGGSHQPILTAIETLQPNHVCFLCSGDDPATGQKGSWTQILGKGKVIKANHTDEQPSLPNIPTQAGLTPEQYEVVEVKPDDFDHIYQRSRRWMENRDIHNERLVADYTGGTKTMSAALVTAALDLERVELQLVTGNRANLIKVKSGTELAIPASVALTRFQRRFQQALIPWSRFAYDESADLLKAAPPPNDTTLRGKHQRARDLSLAFAAWDRFDHATARHYLEPYRPLLGSQLPQLFGALDRLTGDTPAREPLLIFDLWRNSQRRAVQHRWDDAVARLYRLIEWSAQWLLRSRAHIDTADIPPHQIPEGLPLTPGRNGKIQAGLYAAWQLAAHHCGPEAETFWNENHKRLLDYLQVRNTSILAHGFQPLEEHQWRQLATWTETTLLPFLLQQSSIPPWRISHLPPQLPGMELWESLKHSEVS